MMINLKQILSLSLLLPTGVFAANNRPNIIFFMIDDNGWVDSQVAYGPEIYPNNLRFNTPNMLRLASRSVLMTNAYACSVSTPTRTCLMSGMNSAHTGITNWTAALKNVPSDGTGGGDIGNGKPLDVIGDLIRPDWNLNGLSPKEGIEHTQYANTFVQILKDAGYYTIHVGKAHWAAAGTPGVNPYNMGFVVNISGGANGMPTSYQAKDNYGNTPEKWNYMAIQNMAEYYGSDVHLTEALTQEALKTLSYPIKHKQPFYLYMAHYATHTPIQPDDRYIQKYLEAGMDQGQARYASMVEGVDHSLGEILDFLEVNNLEKNTIIILMTDNGGNSENKAKGGVPHTQNLPLREGKGSVYEGGIRVPLMLSWSGKIAPCTRINTPVIVEDLFPTILDMAGVKEYKVSQQIDGKDLVRLVTKGSQLASKAKADGKLKTQAEEYSFVIPESVSGIDPNRTLIFHYPHQWKPYDLPDIDYLTAVRKGDWKLVYRMKTGALELYNLANDIGETDNIAAQYPEKVKELAKALSDKLREWKSPMPTIKSTGKSVPMPDEMIK